MAADPVLIAYTAKRSNTRDSRVFWTRIGRAYPHETGAGLTVVLDSIPLDGRIILLEPFDDDSVDLTDRTVKTRSGRSGWDTPR